MNLFDNYVIILFMNKFCDLINNNEKWHDRLDQMIDPLQRSFGIDVFWHVTVHHTGQLSSLCSYHDAMQHFWENKCYNDMDFFISPCQLKNGYFLLNYDAGYEKYLDGITGKYFLHHPFLMIRKEGKNKAHLFGFSSKKNNPALPSLYMNNLPLLNGYLDHYLQQNRSVFHKSYDSAVDMVVLRGQSDFFGKKYGEESLGGKNLSILKELGLNSFHLKAASRLSAREKQVFYACVEGKTANQNGEELGLSPRTVYFYLEHVKDKLGIFSRDELIQTGKLLEMSGFFDEYL